MASATISIPSASAVGLTSGVSVQVTSSPTATQSTMISFPGTGSAGRVLNTFLSGGSDPAVTDGIAGDYFLNNTSYVLFGPKTATGWPPAGQSLRAAGATFTEGHGPPVDTSPVAGSAYFDIESQTLYIAS